MVEVVHQAVLDMADISLERKKKISYIVDIDAIPIIV